MNMRLILRICICTAFILMLGLPVLPAAAAGEYVEIHWDAEYLSPQETYFSSASTVYLIAGRDNYVSGDCTADLHNKRTGEINTIVLTDIDSTANYTASFIPDAAFSDIEHGDHLEIKVYMGNEQISKRSVYIDDDAPTITTRGAITLTNDVRGDGVASIGDTITYVAGVEGTKDAVIWTVDLSAFGLSATASPGSFTIPNHGYDSSFSAVETVTDKAKNTVSGRVTVVGNFSLDARAPVITIPGTITLTEDTNSNRIVDVGDEIKYAAGTVEASDSDVWKADLSAWGLSTTAEPGTYTVAAANATLGFVEMVWDNGGNVDAGEISPASQVSIAYIWPDESYLGDIQSAHISVKNTGGYPGNVALTLSVNGVVQSRQTVALAAGVSESMVLIFQADVVGTQTVKVNGVGASFKVLERILPAATPVIPASSVPEIPPPPTPQLPAVPEEPVPPFAEAEGPAVTPEAPPQEGVPAPTGEVNMFLVVIAAIAQSLVVYYIVRILRKKALHNTGVVRTGRDV